MVLSPGATLGSYEIVSLLGTGGMGEVYRARDLRLGRDVAIKVLPAALAADPDRLRRLEREARAAAALNHPNIVTVYSVEQAGAVLFLAMELIEGRSLALAIPKGGLPLSDLLTIAIPLTDAIAAAHAKGITHRDLKPANVMMGAGDHDGRVKVLDFGIARLDDASQPYTSATTAAATLTLEGTVLGTVAYMSPEQAAGARVDTRSDLFSLGVILYEMATGQRPFSGDTNVTILSSILRDTPPAVTALNPAMPSELWRIIRHCLVKDPARRYQTAADLRNELEELKQDVDSGLLTAASGVATSRNPRRVSSPRRVLLAAGIVLVTVLVAAAYRWSPSHADRPLNGERAFVQLTAQRGLQESPSLSPDGKWIVYAGNQAGNSDIYLQGVGGHNAIDLTKDSPEDDTEPAFSPDGESIAFRSEREGGGIFVMGRTGESVRRITDSGFSPAWSPDGTRLVFATSFPAPFNRSFSELWIVTLATGEKRRLSSVVEGAQPSWSPHGQRIAYWTTSGEGQPVSQRDIWTVAASGGAPISVTSDAALDINPVWSPDGRFLYFSSDRGGSISLWRIPLDEVTGRVLGPPEAFTTPSPDSRHPSVSADGRLVAYSSFGETSSIQKIAFDPAAATVSGTPATVVGGSRYVAHLNVSPDGRWLAYYNRDRQIDIWISRSDGSGERQLTNDPAYDRNPTFSPDGQWIAFMSNRSGKSQIWLIRPDGSGLRQATDAPDGAMSYNQWSPDGSRLMFSDMTATKNFLFDPLKPWRAQTAQVVHAVTEKGREFSPYAWSPDGKQLLGDDGPTDSEGILAYSLASRRLTRLSDVGAGWTWLNDGRRVLYSHQRKLFVLDSVSKSARELLSVAPDDFDSVTMTRDNRSIYFTRAVQQGNIWLMTLK
jgi:eukaryotic-like serine/threonine-protein kinase